MRYLKLLALAAAALMAFVGAGAASAADLYSTGEKLPVGTSLHATLEAGTTATLSTTDGKTLVDTCTGSTVSGKTTSTGGATVTGSIEKLEWSGCTVTTDTLTPGTLHIDSAGTVTGSGSVVTVNTGVTCRYGTGAGTHLGTLNTGKLAINAVINEQEPKAFLCPDTTKWVANYPVTSPHDLTAESGGGGGVLGFNITTATYQKNQSGKTLSVDNTGTVDWKIVKDSFTSDSGSWSWSGGIQCSPQTVAAGSSCSRSDLACGNATGTVTWTVKVENTAGTLGLEETKTIKCD